MIHFKNFATGLLAGAAVGGIMGMVLDPLKDKDSKKLKKNAGSLMHSAMNVIDDMKK